MKLKPYALLMKFLQEVLKKCFGVTMNVYQLLRKNLDFYSIKLLISQNFNKMKKLDYILTRLICIVTGLMALRTLIQYITSEYKEAIQLAAFSVFGLLSYALYCVSRNYDIKQVFRIRKYQTGYRIEQLCIKWHGLNEWYATKTSYVNHGIALNKILDFISLDLKTGQNYFRIIETEYGFTPQYKCFRDWEFMEENPVFRESEEESINYLKGFLKNQLRP